MQYLRAVLLAAALVSLCGGAAHAERVTGQAGTQRARRVAVDEGLTFGPREALVTVDFFCFPLPRCVDLHEQLTELRTRHPEDLRIRLHVLPPPGMERATELAEASVEAFRQGRYLDFLRAATVKQPGKTTPLELALQAGMDVEALRGALSSGRHAERIADAEDMATRLGVDRAPTLVWNGRIVHMGVIDADSFEPLYAEALGRAQSLRVNGVSGRQLYDRLVEEVRQDGSFASRIAATRAAVVPPPRIRVAQAGSPARGPATAPVTVLVVTDLQLPLSRELWNTVQRLERAYRGKVRLVFKNLPLPFHATGRLAAEVAACADLQGGLWSFLDRMLTGPRPGPGRDGLLAAAASAGLDARRLAADLDAGRCAAPVDRDLADLRAAGVNAPGLLVNGLMIYGVRRATELRAVIDDELRPGILGQSAATQPR